VPDLSGKTLNEAVSAVQAAHLRFIFVKLPVDSRDQVGKGVRILHHAFELDQDLA